MSVRLFLAERWLPGRVRRAMFRRLARATATAFDAAPPDLGGPEADDVARFARFTREAAERALAAGPAAAAAARDRLFEGARQIGDVIRRATGIRTLEEAMRALRLLYGAIGIDLQGCARTGDIVIARCSFSGDYTPEVCALVSALDDGLVAGLTRGGRLTFEARITAGAPCCRARVTGGSIR